jgi:hypothetical protein
VEKIPPSLLSASILRILKLRLEMIEKLVVSVMVLAVITGCTTSVPISSKNAAPVPSSRILAFHNPTSERTMPIVVTRDAGIIGSACYLEFWIDGTKVALFDAGETTQFFVAPGTHIGEVNWDQEGKGLCGLVNAPTNAEINVKEGRKSSYRLLTITDTVLILPSN